MIIALLVGLLGGGVVQAREEWMAVNFAANQAIAIERQGIRSSGSSRTFWSATALRVPEGRVSYMMTRYRIDCDAETVSILNHVSYSEDGQSLGMERGTGTDPIIPGTVGNTLYDAVCEAVWPAVLPVETVREFVDLSVGVLNDIASSPD